MKYLVNDKSGALRQSISYTFGDYAPDNSNVRGFTKGGAGDEDLTVWVHAGDKTAYYAAFVEFGTNPHVVGGKFAGAWHTGSKPTPFFFPAYRAGKRNHKTNITRAMRKAIRNGVKS